MSKEIMYKFYYAPILNFANKAWTVTSREESGIQACDVKYLRSVIGKAE